MKDLVHLGKRRWKHAEGGEEREKEGGKQRGWMD